MTFLNKLPLEKFLIGFILLFPFLRIFQGIDLTDVGFYLTNGKFMFSHPESVTYAYFFFIPNLLINIAENIFPSGGVIWHNFFGASVMACSSLLLINILRIAGNVSRLSLLALLGTLFLIYYFASPINYNNLSFLELCLVFYFSCRYLNSRNLKLLLFCAFVCGIGFYIRFPNITLALIPTACVLFSDQEEKKLKRILLMIPAFMVGLLIPALLIKALGIWPTFVDSFSIMAQKATSNKSTHNISHLLMIYVKQLTKYLLVGFIYFCIPLILKKIDTAKFKWFILAVLLLLLAVFVKRSTIDLHMVGIACAFAFWIIKDTKLRIYSVLFFITLAITSLGSNVGLVYAKYAIFIMIIPLSIKWEAIKNAPLETTKLALIIVICFFSIQSFRYNWASTYRDLSSRSKLVHKVDHEKLKLIYTTEQRSNLLNESFSLIRNCTDMKEVIFLGNVPMLYYLMDIPPKLRNSWINTFEKPLFEEMFVSKKPKYAVMTKFSVSNQYWPNETSYSEGMNEDKNLGHYYLRFLLTQNYKLKCENLFLKIFELDKEAI